MKTQKTDAAKSTSKTTAKKASGTKELKKDDLKKVQGGSGILSGGNDLSNMIGGVAGVSNSSSGSDGSRSYSSNDSHNADLGLGNELSNLNF